MSTRPNALGHAGTRPLPRLADVLAGDPDPQLTRHAHSLLVSRLLRFGNVLAPSHHDALLTLLSEFTRVAYGINLGRFGYPLPTGMGKSQAIVAWLVALYELKRVNLLRVAVVLSKVEALCGLKRDLVAAGIPEPIVGLRHSYDYDSERPSADGRAGIASLPTNPDANERPILLATHNRIKGTRLHDNHGGVIGGWRDLVIWDESLLVSEPASFSLAKLEQLVKGLAQFFAATGPTWELLKAVSAAVQDAATRRSAGELPGTFTLVGLPIMETLDELRAVRKASRSGALWAAAKELISFLDLAPEELTISTTAQGAGLIMYRISVPKALNRVVVLDASYNARALARLDPSISLRFTGMEQLKRFDRVTVRHMSIAAGRESVEIDCGDESKSGRKVPRLVSEIALSMRPDEAAIVFTHKHRDPRQPNIAESIRAMLRAAGIDPDARIDVAGTLRQRFVFLTWGDETSLSEYSYCRHVILAGLMYRSHLDLAAHMSGQVGDLLLHPDTDAIGAVQLSELLHLVYQAMSRGACRVVENGQARPMTAWLMMKGESLRAPLMALMPGLCWQPHRSPVLVDDTQVAADAELVAIYLRNAAATRRRVSVSELKGALPCLSTSRTKRRFTRAVELACQLAGWLREARSLVFAGAA